MTDVELLREHLRIARKAGFRFSAAWPVALEATLRAVPPGDRLALARALIATRTAWERAYERRGRMLALSTDASESAI